MLVLLGLFGPCGSVTSMLFGYGVDVMVGRLAVGLVTGLVVGLIGTVLTGVLIGVGLGVSMIGLGRRESIYVVMSCV